MRVNITDVWINDAYDLADCRAFDCVSALSRSSADSDVVQVTGSGRVRMIRRVGVVTTWRLACGLVDDDDLAWLIAHARRLVCVRDPRGQKVFGQYSAPDESVIVEVDRMSSITLTLTAVTYSEAV